jgi:hypothetical protein
MWSTMWKAGAFLIPCVWVACLYNGLGPWYIHPVLGAFLALDIFLLAETTSGCWNIFRGP